MVRNRAIQTPRGSALQARVVLGIFKDSQKVSVAGVEGWKERVIGNELVRWRRKTVYGLIGHCKGFPFALRARKANERRNEQV